MSQIKMIRLLLVSTLVCPALPVVAQNKPAAGASAKKTAETSTTKATDAAEEKGEAAKKAAPKKPAAKTPSTPEKDAASAESDADETAGETEDEDADETAEEDMSEDNEDDAEADEGDEAEEDETAAEEPMTLAPPKTVNLDMEALGKMDPEKELAEGGELDKKAAEADKVTWTERAMDILELHGYYRLRPELYHKFNIRGDDAVYNRTMAQRYGRSAYYKNSTSTGANMRFRLSPTLHISEEVRIKSQMDFLDNVMLGSTPRYFQGYDPVWGKDNNTTDLGRIQGWNMGPPSGDDMFVVRRVWGEVDTPLGQLRFGRMGDHFGTGMLHNDGNQLFNDFGDTVDRIMFAAKINDWLIAPAFDFPNEGIVGADASGRPFDVSQLDDAYRLVGIFAYMHDKELQEAMLRRGDWLVNAGLYFAYRWQVLSFESRDQEGFQYNPTLDSTSPESDSSDEASYKFYKRDLWTITPDIWLQLLYGTFHLEVEASLIFGELGNPVGNQTATDEMNALKLLQWGGVLQIDYGLMNDALRIGMEFGYAQGDKDVEGVRAPADYQQHNNDNNNTFSAFSFNPAYNTDLILHRHILGSVAQSLYLNAWLKYDFLNQKMGQKLGLRADVFYSRAIFADSTISDNSANLGVELNAQLRYQSADGFYAGVAYGVLFPLGGFKGDPTPDENGVTDRYNSDNDLSIPQTLQTVLGITF